MLTQRDIEALRRMMKFTNDELRVGPGEVQIEAERGAVHLIVPGLRVRVELDPDAAHLLGFALCDAAARAR